MLRDDIDNMTTILAKILSWVNTNGYKQGTAFVYKNVTDNPAVQHGFVTFKSKKETIHQIDIEFYSLSTGKTYKNTIDRTDNTYLFTKWKEQATTDKIDISSCLRNGWQLYNSNYACTLIKSGNHIKITGVIKGGTTSYNTSILENLPYSLPNTVYVQTKAYEKTGKLQILVVMDNKIIIQNYAITDNTEITLDIDYYI